jgi:hypothetical protein
VLGGGARTALGGRIVLEKRFEVQLEVIGGGEHVHKVDRHMSPNWTVRHTSLLQPSADPGR